MRNLLIVILFYLLMVGQAAAEEFTLEHSMANWISYVCDIRITANDVTYVGEHETWYYFYSSFNEDCQFTHTESHVWKIPSDMLNSVQ